MLPISLQLPDGSVVKNLPAKTGDAVSISGLWWHLEEEMVQFSSVQFSHSVGPDSLRPMSCSTPGLPVQHQLLEATQTHVYPFLYSCRDNPMDRGVRFIVYGGVIVYGGGKELDTTREQSMDAGNISTSSLRICILVSGFSRRGCLLAPHGNKLWLIFSVIAHKLEKIRGKVFPDLANTLTEKNIFSLWRLPTFIFWPKKIISFIL